jgi:hypothetical protein
MPEFPLIAAALFVIPAPVLAQIVFEDAPIKVAPTGASSSKSDLDKIECRAQDVTGSRLKRHQVCLTKEQWWLYEHEAKEKLQEWQVVGYTSH